MENDNPAPLTFEQSLAQYQKFPANLVQTLQFPHTLESSQERLDAEKERLFKRDSEGLQLFELPAAGDQGRYPVLVEP